MFAALASSGPAPWKFTACETVRHPIHRSKTYKWVTSELTIVYSCGGLTLHHCFAGPAYQLRRHIVHASQMCRHLHDLHDLCKLTKCSILPRSRHRPTVILFYGGPGTVIKTMSHHTARINLGIKQGLMWAGVHNVRPPLQSRAKWFITELRPGTYRPRARVLCFFILHVVNEFPERVSCAVTVASHVVMDFMDLRELEQPSLSQWVCHL